MIADATALEFLQELIRLKSINPPGDERQVALAIKELLDTNGIETELIELTPQRANLVACLRAAGDARPKRTLGISGHMDVVPPGQLKWTHDPFEPVERDGKLYGRGASDMKGGLVAMIFAMLALKRDGVKLEGDLKLLATAGEEAGALGAKQLAQTGYVEDLTALLLGEPSNGEVCIAHKGALWLEITCYGKTAHGARPQLGINAIAHLNQVLTALLSGELKFSYVEDTMLGGPTINVGVISGGVKVNVVPDRCTAEIDIRTVPSQTHDKVLAEVRAVVDSVKAHLPGFKANIRVINDLPCIRTAHDDPFVELVCKEVSKLRGLSDRVTGMSGYTDASAFVPAKKSLPTVILGPGDYKLAHQPDEYIVIDQFLRFIPLYRSIFTKYLGVL
jgi:succinyl-diaminopimelate desuccinylase